MKIALVYDRINKFGGAERLLSVIHKIYPNAPIYTLVHNPQTSSWAKNIKVIPSFFNRLKWLRTRHQLLAPFSAMAFETLNLDQFNIIISLTSESAKAVLSKPHQLHICYCLTPTRYLWGDFAEYPIPKLAKKYFQFADKIYSTRPDHYLAISKEAQKRIKKYYKRHSQVIYPSIDYKFWSNPTRPGLVGNYYLVVSRLEAYKKTDLVIRAFNQLQGDSLKVVGIGSQERRLKKQAHSNIKFLGTVDDNRLRSLYANAKALIFPQIEDFGLTPLEAQATGTPVIAFNRAGASETVIHKKTGILFKRQTVNSLTRAIKLLESNNHKINKKNCQQNAINFNQTRFIKNFRAKVEELWQKRQKIFI